MIEQVVLSRLQRASIARGRFVSVDVGRRSVLVGRVDGSWRAYENVCRHRALRLDFDASSPMSDDGRFLLCHHHGALYHPADGACVTGPCAGQGLVALDIVEDKLGLWVGQRTRGDTTGD